MTNKVCALYHMMCDRLAPGTYTAAHVVLQFPFTNPIALHVINIIKRVLAIGTYLRRGGV